MTSTHGTLSAYKIDRCRCDDCEQANRAYTNRRRRLIAYGQWRPYVDASPVRAHLEHLSRSGMGFKTASLLAGLAPSSVAKILYGAPYRGMGPTKRVRPETAASLLAIRPDLEVLGGASLVEGTGTRRRLRALVACGWSQNRLAGRLGMERSNFQGLMTPGRRVYAATARRARDVYDELWNTAPPEEGHRDKIAASRARRYAAERGWPVPMAWDDDTIDDPAATPDTGAVVRRRDALAEDAAELLRQGYTPELAAARLGVSRKYLTKAIPPAAV